MGISFYTFQTLSYSIDVYRGRMSPWSSLLDFGLFVSFFPQLVAGPIVRATDFLPQLKAPRRPSAAQVSFGFAMLTLGLFEKIVISDAMLAPVADAMFALEQHTFVTSWLGALAFAGQIFCDFAGYSTCAIGVALCLGFSLPDNFRFPYAAIGFSDFWRRWHISLSQWLRDYLYISLGGNRGGEAKRYRNLAFTMLLGGLWHGASWTFVVWGALHGGLLVVERLVVGSPLGRMGVWSTRFGRALLGALTFACVSITWVWFRAPSLEIAWSMTCALVGADGFSAASIGMTRLLIGGAGTALVVAVHIFMRDKDLETVVARAPRAALGRRPHRALARHPLHPG